jgi:tRNA-modifying protein YgfZ
MRTALEGICLDDTGIVRVRGPDAVKFLQGQLSNDVAKLGAQQSILAGYHNPQGRVIALLRLVRWDADDILAVVPRELAAVVAARLGKYVLRAKVKITDESSAWRIEGLVDTGASAGGARDSAGHTGAVGPGASAGGAGDAGGHASLTALDLPTSVGAQARAGGAVTVRVAVQPPRWLVISPAEATSPDSTSPLLDYMPTDRATWQRLEIAAGQPQVYAATSETFVAQMLNLDVLNAIAFDKGCYTGQEVIARAHYRGRVKRRMQRFVSRQPCQLAPGDSGKLADGRAFEVVLAAQLADGRCDFLAVAPLIVAGNEAQGAVAAGPGPGAESGGAGTGGNVGAAAGAGAVAAAGDGAVGAAGGGAVGAAGGGAVAAAAVAPTVAAAAALTAAAAPASTAPAAGPTVVMLDAEQVEVPYSLPE